MDKNSKAKAIESLKKEQEILLKALHKIIKMKPAKRVKTCLNRLTKTTSILLQIRQIQAQKEIILLQPIYKFPKGGV